MNKFNLKKLKVKELAGEAATNVSGGYNIAVAAFISEYYKSVMAVRGKLFITYSQSLCSYYFFTNF